MLPPSIAAHPRSIKYKHRRFPAMMGIRSVLQQQRRRLFISPAIIAGLHQSPDRGDPLAWNLRLQLFATPQRPEGFRSPTHQQILLPQAFGRVTAVAFKESLRLPGPNEFLAPKPVRIEGAALESGLRLALRKLER